MNDVSMIDERAALLADSSLRGRPFCEAYTKLIDRWLAEIYATTGAAPRGVALVAVGGYGRGELAPQSDLDLVVLTADDQRSEGERVAESIWYPIWDAGLKLGHAVRSLADAVAMAENDIETATAMLDVRCLAGDETLAVDLGRRALESWQARLPERMPELLDAARSRHGRLGQVAFRLEPDIKNGRGGLRDAHLLRWLQQAGPVLGNGDEEVIERAGDLLLDVRVALHRLTGRPGDLVPFEEQDALAETLGYASASDLMRALAGEARSLGWIIDEVFGAASAGDVVPTPEPITDHLVVRGRHVGLLDATQPLQTGMETSELILEAAKEAAGRGLRVDPALLDRSGGIGVDAWSSVMREHFVDVLATGSNAIPVLESLDRYGILERLLRDWPEVRCKPQRNVYHTFTVDRHLCQAAANAAELLDRVDRPDLLLVGSLLHDIGKGRPGDHTVVGMKMVAEIAPHMGFSQADTDVLVRLVELHLLLPDVATRRDLSDEQTILDVAGAVRDVPFLRMLAALTEADSKATGPAAWGTWKAGLVQELVARVAAHIDGDHEVSGGFAEFPTPDHLELMAVGQRLIRPSGDVLTVIDVDRPGLFSRVAGVLSLNGLDVLGASAHSTPDMALSEFTVANSFDDEIAWEVIVPLIEAALDGRLAVRARLEDRARQYDRRGRTRGASVVSHELVIDNHASTVATVVEVRAPDSIGLLYRITSALAELDLDIRSAKVHTLADDVVDAFYLQTSSGDKIADADHLNEVERALRHVLGVD